MSDYINTKRKIYGDAWFLPVCEKCGRFVKADESVFINGFGQFDKERTNCNCSKCGRSNMLFEGYY